MENDHSRHPQARGTRRRQLLKLTVATTGGVVAGNYVSPRLRPLGTASALTLSGGTITPPPSPPLPGSPSVPGSPPSPATTPTSGPGSGSPSTPSRQIAGRPGPVIPVLARSPSGPAVGIPGQATATASTPGGSMPRTGGLDPLIVAAAGAAASGLGVLLRNQARPHAETTAGGDAAEAQCPDEPPAPES